MSLLERCAVFCAAGGELYARGITLDERRAHELSVETGLCCSVSPGTRKPSETNGLPNGYACTFSERGRNVGGRNRTECGTASPGNANLDAVITPECVEHYGR